MIQAVAKTTPSQSFLAASASWLGTICRAANARRLLQHCLDARWRAVGALCAAALLATLAGCTVTPLSAPLRGTPHIPISDTGPWSGRLTLTVGTEPPQLLYAGFTLEGNAGMGQLALTSPLGNRLALLRWEPGHIELIQGNQVKTYGSLDDLTMRITGAPIPMPALFDWLHGHNTAINGWQANLNTLAQGRLTAQRLYPTPAIQLRIALDRAE
jgi:outer membrane lipoprotein LolB